MSEDEKSVTEGVSRKAADALADAKRQAALAEARKLEAEAEAAELGTQRARIETEKALEAEAKRKAGNEFLHIYDFATPVADASVATAIQTLNQWSRLCPDCDITIQFCSPGGEAIAGMRLFDFILDLRARGHKVTTEAWGYAASMAGILLQAGTVRRCGAESWILIHQITAAVRGKIGEIDDEVEFIHKMGDRVLDIFATRAREAAENGTAKKALSRAQFAKRWERKDWWLSSKEALEFGVVDEVF